MAKRTKTRTRYRTKTVYRKARGGGGSFKPIIDGALAGVIGGFLSGYLGSYSHPAAAIGIGYFRNNNVLKTEGARTLGMMLTGGLAGNGNNNKFLGM